MRMPLGGTSNHFRTRALREMGGWDAFNVTEDADLGVRLSRLRYRTAMLFSQTYEEAPVTLPATRWLAGKYGRKTVFQVSMAIFAAGLLLDTQATTTLQDTIQSGTTGAWVFIQRPNPYSQGPAEFYTSDFIDPV